MWRFLMVLWVGLLYVIVVFPDHTHFFIYEFNPFVDKMNFDKMSNMINFRINIWTESMLSITPREKCYIIKSVGSTI